jgi:tripeptide aminopeptidase
MMHAPPAVGASAPEREQLGALFAELCRIESPSGRERACAERVRAELESLGLDVYEDDAAIAAGSDCGNLLARIPAGGAPRNHATAEAQLSSHAAQEARRSDRAPEEDRPSDHTPDADRPSVLLCAHLDTVPLAAPVEPVIVDDGWENANEGILGADNKAAVAVLLALARRVQRDGSPVDIELLFTVGEEVSLAGARAFDAACLRSQFGYTFDHASPIGELVLASPSHFRVRAAFRGAAAHAGVRPEQGRSAILAAAHAIASMPHGRLDEETTVNVGRIAGGSAINVVPEHCALLAEVRSIDPERAETVAGELVDRVHEAANRPECECDVDIAVERTFVGYRTAPGAPAVRAAELALRNCGFEPVRIASGGASDANALLARGLTVVNLANGTERNHEPTERVSVAALEGMLDVAFALLPAVAAQSPATSR